MTRNRLVVIGGDAAGMSAAAKVRREQPEHEIVVFEKTEYTSYSACGMPYLISGMVENPSSLIVRSPQTFREKFNIDVRTRHEVVSIDADRQYVEVFDHKNNRTFTESYDQLLIATGASPHCPDVAGDDADGIFGLSTLSSGLLVQKYLKHNKPQSAVVVGGGYIGLEMAEALVRQKLKVSLVQRGEEVMGTLDRDMGSLVSQALRGVGVELYLEEEFIEFESINGQVSAVVTNRRTLPADIVILGMGVRPNSELATSAKLELGVRKAIKVNQHMQSSIANIWAAGDCATTHHRITGQPFYIALGTVANKQGVVAGINIAGGNATFPGVVGTAVSKICAYEVARTGLQEKEAREHNYDYDTATIEAKTRAGYYPGAGKITVKLIGEKGSGRLLGGQIVGMEGAAKRIDILATALTARMTVEELVDLDLSYAPPFSPVWDPVQTAARQLVKKL